MIVLDTNVVSEAMKPDANPAVRAWLNEQIAETLYLTCVTLAEMLFGIAVLPASKRRNTLTRALDGLLELFGDRVLPFDIDAGRIHRCDRRLAWLHRRITRHVALRGRRAPSYRPVAKLKGILRSQTWATSWCPFPSCGNRSGARE
jgi:predicted nucleic acid-binding protein